MATNQPPRQDRPFRRRVPNSFVSIRITSDEIKHNMSMVQQEMIQMMPQMADVVQKLSKLHITLMVLNLQSDGDIEIAKKATAVAYDKIATDLANPLILKFDKIGTFTNSKNQTNVLFVRLCDDINKQRLMRLADIVRSTFEEYRLFSTDDRPLNPHLTIAKLYRDTPHIRNIHPHLYQKYNDLMFGSEEVRGIELLAMGRLAEEEDGGGVPGDGVPPNIPHGVFLVKKPKLTTGSQFESDQPNMTAGLQQQSECNPSERQALLESSQVVSSSGGSLVLVRPQDVVTDNANPIGPNLSSAQTVETSSGACETKEKTPPVAVKEQNKSIPFLLPSVDDGTDKTHDDVDKQSQETCHPLIGVPLGNSSINVTMSQQEVENNNRLPVDHQLSQDQQATHEHAHQHMASPDHNVLLVEADIQSVHQNEEPVDQDKGSTDQDHQEKDHDSEDGDNPFSHLVLSSDTDNNEDFPLKTSKKKQRRKAKSKPLDGSKKKKPERIIPDSFIAVRFSSPELRHKLEAVQQHMIEMDKKLKPTLIPPVKLHVTLLTLQLNNDTSLIEKAKDCLSRCCCKLQEIGQQEIVVTMRGLRSFRNQVVYAAIEDDSAKEQLVQLAELVCATFAENGLSGTDKRATFIPHLTIAKTTRTSGKKRVKMIDPKSYEEHKDDYLGVQPINTLELLSMTRPPDKQGYYHCYCRQNFSSTDTTATTLNCPEDADTDVKQQTDRENVKMVSAPCTAVKFIPRVLITKKQDQSVTDSTSSTNVAVSRTEMEKNIIEET